MNSNKHISVIVSLIIAFVLIVSSIMFGVAWSITDSFQDGAIQNHIEHLLDN